MRLVLVQSKTFSFSLFSLCRLLGQIRIAPRHVAENGWFLTGFLLSLIRLTDGSFSTWSFVASRSSHGTGKNACALLSLLHILLSLFWINYVGILSGTLALHIQIIANHSFWHFEGGFLATQVVELPFRDVYRRLDPFIHNELHGVAGHLLNERCLCVP